jgi:hypothetical protein
MQSQEAESLPFAGYSNTASDADDAARIVQTGYLLMHPAECLPLGDENVKGNFSVGGRERKLRGEHRYIPDHYDRAMAGMRCFGWFRRIESTQN